MTELTRRHALAGALAFSAVPLRAQSDPWQRVLSTARALDQCHGMIIEQDAVELVSEVFRGPPRSRTVPIKSVSKSLVAALTGIAVDRGEIPNLSSTLGDLAPELIPTNADPKVGSITIENLVTMQAGLERTSGANYGAWVSSSDWVANALSRSFVAEPGTRMLYSTGSFHILGAVLSQVSGESLLSLARTRLGDPLGIEIPAWDRDPQGRYLGGNGMALSLPAMIRFGELYRQGGRWNDTQVISEAWIEASFVRKTRSRFSGLGYGLGWFLGSVDGDTYALARGFGGQIICLVPSLKLTIAITSDPTRPARSGGYFGDLLNLIETEIVPIARTSV